MTRSSSTTAGIVLLALSVLALMGMLVPGMPKPAFAAVALLLIAAGTWSLVRQGDRR